MPGLLEDLKKYDDEAFTKGDRQAGFKLIREMLGPRNKADSDWNTARILRQHKGNTSR